MLGQGSGVACVTYVRKLGVIQIDVEVCGWTVKKKRVVVVQEAINPQVSVILGMNVLQELDQQMVQDMGLLYWKELPGVRAPKLHCGKPFINARCCVRRWGDCEYPCLCQSK